MILAIDVGGTHADGVLLFENQGNNRLQVGRKEKKAVRKNGLRYTVTELLKELLQDIDFENSDSQLKRVVISTTLPTNLLAQEKDKNVGLMLIPGPGAAPERSFFGDENIVLEGFIDHRGKEVKKLSQKQVINAAEKFKASGINNIAIAGKFSCRNPRQEQQARDWLQHSSKFNFESIIPGHLSAPVLNFPRRAATACCSAAIAAEQRHFSEEIEKIVRERAGEKTEIKFLKSDGGTMSKKQLKRDPVKAVNSGPAASIMGIRASMSDAYSSRTFVTLDMGGTTTDIGLFVEGEPAFEEKGIEVNNISTSIKGLFSRSVPLGGDSCIRIKNGEIKIGPERAGPPAALGGNSLTPTDALVFLYRRKGSPFISEADSKMSIQIGENAFESEDWDIERSRKALKRAAENLAPAVLARAGDEFVLFESAVRDSEDKAALLIIERFTAGISEKINDVLKKLAEKPVYTVKELLEDVKIEPELILGMGGPARGFLPLVAEKINLEYQLVPHAEVANAIGAGCTRPTRKINVRVDTRRGRYVIPELGENGKLEGNIKENWPERKAKEALRKRYPEKNPEIEITRKESFPTVSGFRTTGNITEVTAQVKPDIIGKIVKSGADGNA